MWQPFARIVLRYGVGLIAGWTVGDALAGDPDMVDTVAAGVALAAAAGTEWWYRTAKKRGGAT